MIVKTLDFKRRVTAKGRNGDIIMTGVEVVSSTNETLFISPLTSRKIPANCWIEIPKEDVQEFIQVLKESYDNKD